MNISQLFDSINKILATKIRPILTDSRYFPDLLSSNAAGGYVCVYTRIAQDRDWFEADEPPYVIGRVGGCVDRALQCSTYRFAQEKAVRLVRMVINHKTGHVSSWQSRSPEENQWGGAVRDKDTVFSFSGLTEHADEALMLLVMLEMGFMGAEEAKKIAQISENRVFFLAQSI